MAGNPLETIARLEPKAVAQLEAAEGVGALYTASRGLSGVLP